MRLGSGSWTTNIIIPLQKKGDHSLMTNYRGISLMSIVTKVYNRILLNRIRPVVDPVLRQNLAGFRKGRGCTYQIHFHRRIMEGAWNQQLPLSVTFIDFRKAFDSIDRLMMLAIRRHYGIHGKIVRAIRVLYDNSGSVSVCRWPPDRRIRSNYRSSSRWCVGAHFFSLLLLTSWWRMPKKDMALLPTQGDLGGTPPKFLMIWISQTTLLCYLIVRKMPNYRWVPTAKQPKLAYSSILERQRLWH